jgi:hypothetical protein
MKVLVCGGRNFDDAEAVNKALDIFHAGEPITLIIQGGATGADELAQKWADSHGIWCHVFRPDWATHGSAAGPIRNQRMIDKGQPDLVMAFPGGRGTADMVRRAKAADIHVIEVPPRVVIEQIAGS